MMSSPGHIFDIVALVCFGISAVPMQAPPYPYWQPLLSLGLAFFTLGHLF
jgi:hypothetical protein